MGNRCIVLVHGAWHGGWCWKKVIPLFQRTDYTLLAPTLTGLGEKHSSLTSQTNLSTHINEIVGLIKTEEIKNVVLVGHSYAGAVISGVAQVIPERIGKLVYLDAIYLQDGESILDHFPSVEPMVEEIQIESDIIEVLPPPSPTIFGVRNPDDIKWMEMLFTPMPYKCYTQRSSRTNPLADQIGKAYIRCTVPPNAETDAALNTSYKRVESEHGKCIKINFHHDVMVTHPSKCHEALIEAMKD